MSTFAWSAQGAAAKPNRDVSRDAAARSKRTCDDLAVAFDRCGTSLHRYLAVRAGGDCHLADDLMQQIWVQATAAASPPGAGELEFWLRAIARNLIRAHWRSQARRPALLPLADPRHAADLAETLAERELTTADLERRETRDQLLLAITALPAEEQELILGRYWRGRSLEELAAETGIGIRAVEGRLYRARQRLRELLTSMEVWE